MFVRDYQQYKQNNVPFRGNDLLNGNQQLQNTYNNTQFQEYLYMARMRRLQKAKIMNNVKITNEELTNYVIGPMKIEKATQQELNNDHDNIEKCYIISAKKVKKNKKTEYDVNNYLKELWDKRTNQPYKRIMHKENWEKNIDNEEDLIVHKVTKVDKDKRKLDKTYKKLLKLKKEDNKQIAEIYSADNEIQHMRDFQYSHVYKYRLKHKAKNHEDMQKIYKDEQKKLNKQRNEIDSALTMLLNSDILSDSDKLELQKELAKNSDKILKNKEYNLKSSKYINKKLDKELQNIKEVLGEKEFNKLIKESDKKLKENKKNKKIKKTKSKKYKENNIPVISLKKISLAKNNKSDNESSSNNERDNNSGSDNQSVSDNDNQSVSDNDNQSVSDNDKKSSS